MSAAAERISWDEWRSRYDEWSFAQQQAFYDHVFAEFPDQARFSTRVLDRLLGLTDSRDPLMVVELGGWDGGFAAAMLPRHPRLVWENHEICRAAVQSSVCDSARYRAVALDDWYWAQPHTADLFVASHVLEHLRFDDVKKVLDATDSRWMFLQAPLGEGPSGWGGYHGTHILEVGWTGMTDELGSRGYRLLSAVSEPWARCFERDATA